MTCPNCDEKESYWGHNGGIEIFFETGGTLNICHTCGNIYFEKIEGLSMYGNKPIEIKEGVREVERNRFCNICKHNLWNGGDPDNCNNTSNGQCRTVYNDKLIIPMCNFESMEGK